MTLLTKTTGIELEVNLKLWIEPQTGYLVKYEDHATAYYYDLANKTRLYPWNKFHNEYKTISITEHVVLAERAKILDNVIHIVAPVALVIFGLLGIGTHYLIKRKATASRKFLPHLIATCAFAGTIAGWYVTKATINLYTEIKFESDVTELKEAILASLSDYALALQGGKGLLNASEEVTREEWAKYVEGLELNKNYPGMQRVWLYNLC